jgi:uncharacterized protein YndB with AHSA1/START domain
MKAIKLIFAVVTLMAIVFFSTGLFIKETRYQVRVEIQKPISEVFMIFNTDDVMMKWMPEIKSIQPIFVKPGMVGSQYKMDVENDGQKSSITKKIMAYIPNQKLTLYYDAQDMQKTEDYHFTEENGNTLLVKDVVTKSESYILNCMFPYLKGFFEDIDQRYLDTFKTYIEN